MLPAAIATAPKPEIVSPAVNWMLPALVLVFENN